MAKLKISLKALRKIISEEIDRLVRRSAGFSGSAGIAGRGRGSSEIPPLGLGDEEQQEEERYGKEQQKNQFSVRVDSRKTRQD
jgi:hypothetical protein